METPVTQITWLETARTTENVLRRFRNPPLDIRLKVRGAPEEQQYVARMRTNPKVFLLLRQHFHQIRILELFIEETCSIDCHFPQLRLLFLGFSDAISSLISSSHHPFAPRALMELSNSPLAERRFLGEESSSKSF